MKKIKNIFLPLVKSLAKASRGLTMFLHKLQFRMEWGSEETPEWFDHYYDQYYLWRKRKEAFWLERGIFNLLGIKAKAKVLELCCGDGFNTYHFYSDRAASILAVDFDKAAITHAKKNNQANNISFELCDIRYDLPVNDKFDNVIWDASIQHFTEEEIRKIMTDVKLLLGTGGILSGYTAKGSSNNIKSFTYHEKEFGSKEELYSFFDPYFKNILVLETKYTERSNLFFFASDGVIPFDKNWGDVITTDRKILTSI